MTTNNQSSKHLNNEDDKKTIKASIAVRDLNDLLSCRLCKGYLIDATTIVECLHSFCKTCLVHHLDSSAPNSRFCPVCEVQIHKTKPKLNIRSDPTLQDIVYKLVPGLFKTEMNRRREFYDQRPEAAVGLSNEEKGEISGERLIFTPDDTVMLSIEYFPEVITYSFLPFTFSKVFSLEHQNGALNCGIGSRKSSQRRYLKCQGGMRVYHLKKWLRLKYDVKPDHDIEVMYKHEPLNEEYTMMDLAYIYSWRKNGPLCLYYKILEPQKFQKDVHVKETMQNFFIPQIPVAKRRHTVKHKHSNSKPSKVRCFNKNNDDLKLVTCNPVNEPLPAINISILDRI